PELSLTPEADAALLAQAQRIDHAVVVRLLELLGEAIEAVRAGADARTRLELALVKAARPQVDATLRALLTRIERLESAGAGEAPAGPGPGVDAPLAAQTDPQPSRDAPAAPDEPSHEPPQGDPLHPPAPEDLEGLRSLWPAVVDLVRAEHALLGALIAEAQPV